MCPRRTARSRPREGAEQVWPRELASRTIAGSPPHRGRPDPRVPARPVAGDPRALQVPPLLLGLRGAGHRDLRHTARLRPRGVAPAAVQSVQPRGIRPRVRADALLPPLPDSRLDPLLNLV